MAPGVGAAIRDLLARGRLSATSCMTTGPYWQEEAALLRPFAESADLGLHITLTDQTPLGAMPRLAPGGRLPSLPRLVALSMTGRLRSPEIQAEISAEIERQLDRFEQAMGMRPAHLDGHQHVHQLAGIYPAVIELHRRRLAAAGTYVRSCREPFGRIRRRGVATFHAGVVAALGRGFNRAAARAPIAGNRSFRGVLTFQEKTGYAKLFGRFLIEPVPGTLIMCHPGVVDDTLRQLDPVTGTREAEYAFLAGDEMPAILAAAGVRLARFREIAAESDFQP
jgi:predicted glycoside hydrolase/deacetylase ChbG (UPF0249 family)